MREAGDGNLVMVEIKDMAAKASQRLAHWLLPPSRQLGFYPLAQSASLGFS